VRFYNVLGERERKRERGVFRFSYSFVFVAFAYFFLSFMFVFWPFWGLSAFMGYRAVEMSETDIQEDGLRRQVCM
jgi:hypothetical protein